MKRLLACVLLCAATMLTACAPGSWYGSHPTTREQLIQSKGKPDSVIRADDGSEKLIYRFEGDGVVYMYYQIEKGMVVRSGMQ